MEYDILFHERAIGQIARWGLSTWLRVEIQIGLRDELAQDPLKHLHRADDDQGGSFYTIRRVDPDSPRFRHVFRFRVFFMEDEKHLFIVRGSYWRFLNP
jgi:hypothetical protein